MEIRKISFSARDDNHGLMLPFFDKLKRSPFDIHRFSCEVVVFPAPAKVAPDVGNLFSGIAVEQYNAVFTR